MTNRRVIRNVPRSLSAQLGFALGYAGRAEIHDTLGSTFSSRTLQIDTGRSLAKAYPLSEPGPLQAITDLDRVIAYFVYYTDLRYDELRGPGLTRVNFVPLQPQAFKSKFFVFLEMRLVHGTPDLGVLFAVEAIVGAVVSKALASHGSTD